MASGYITRSKVLSDTIKDMITLFVDGETNYKKLVAELCIMGFKKKQVEEMLQNFDDASILLVKKDQNKIINPYYEAKNN